MDENKFISEIIQAAKRCELLISNDIDTERGFITKSHNFEYKINELDDIFINLLSRVPEDTEYKELYTFIENISLKIKEIQKQLQSQINHELHFIEEEEYLIAQIDVELKHKDWKAAWITAQKVAVEKTSIIKVDINSLSLIKNILETLIKNITDEEYVVMEEKHIVAIRHEKIGLDALEKVKEFLIKVNKFFRFYLGVFEHMIIKEQHLLENEPG